MPISKSDRTFWYVYNPLRGAPTVKHFSYESARKEAVRLATKHPREKIYVLEVVEEFEHVNELLYRIEITNDERRISGSIYRCQTSDEVRRTLKSVFGWPNKFVSSLLKILQHNSEKWINLSLGHTTVYIEIEDKTCNRS